MSYLWALFLLLTLSSRVSHTAATSHRGLGVNYGTLGNNLPSPSRSVELLRAAGAGAVKIYDADPAILAALAGTHMSVSIMVPNDRIASLAASAAAADRWICANLTSFYPRTRIRYLLVGNEVLSDYSLANSTWPHLVRAMANLHASLRSRHIRNIKVGTTIAMDALAAKFPPSAGAFRGDIACSVIRPMLKFLKKTNSYYFVDAYPYFVWSESPKTVPLDYALFEGDASMNYVDQGTGLVYTNALDQMLDAVIAAMGKLGYGDVKIAIAETGWPNGCDLDQIGGNVHNAAIYNRNLARRMTRNPPPGTPARPGVKMPVFVFSLYNENQKSGPGTERHWGMFYPNATSIYGIDLTGRRPLDSYPPLPAPENDTPYKGPIWCVLAGGKVNETAVEAAVAYACGQRKGTCDAIQPGRPCYHTRASFAFNSYWQQFRKAGATCDFNGLAVQTNKDPSYGHCKFPSSLN